MKKRSFWNKKLLILNVIVLLLLIFFIPMTRAQLLPYYSPYFGISSFGYYPFLPFTSPLVTASAFRYANVPTTATLTFPAPTLPAVPVSTIGGVGITSLIPSIAVTQPISLSQLITTPLSPLITYTPLSLVGLTFAPVPVLAP